jgi:Domain of unknown function (DUF4886)
VSRRRTVFWILALVACGFAALRSGAIAPPASGVRQSPATPPVPAPPGPNAPTLHVLFVGNSLTYAGDLPAMIQGLARTAGVNLLYEQHTPGGARLLNHAADPQVRALLARGGWDAVVLQEQSEWPAFSDEQVRSGIEPYATALAAEARAGSPAVRLLLYETPARRDGDSANLAVSPEMATYEGMQLRIDRTYERLAALLRGTVVPAGVAWRLARREHPEINLYADQVHPGRVGAYLIACVFHATLLARSPVGSGYTAGLDPAVAAALQAIAWRAASEEGRGP